MIINNRNFAVNTNDPQSKEMPERRGTDVDASKYCPINNDLVIITWTGERTGQVVRALDSGSGDPGMILGRVGVLFP